MKRISHCYPLHWSRTRLQLVAIASLDRAVIGLVLDACSRRARARLRGEGDVSARTDLQGSHIASVLAEDAEGEGEGCKGAGDDPHAVAVAAAEDGVCRGGVGAAFESLR